METANLSPEKSELIPSFRLLGVPISIVNKQSTLSTIDDWITAKKGGYICIRDTHGIIHAQDNSSFLEIHEHALMVTPDGVPIVWFGRLCGHKSLMRVCGPDLVGWLCEYSVERGFRHYFFGGADGVAERMAAKLQLQYSGLKIVGTESPPFRETSAQPDLIACERIRKKMPDIVWVGLGSPKQEHWMHVNSPHVPGAIFIGVGAAFDFHSGTISRAPKFMQQSGLEWLYRLFQEPQRLWRRYIIFGPKFLYLAIMQWLRDRGELH